MSRDGPRVGGIYLDDRQLSLLRRLSAQRDEPIAGLVRAAVDDWLDRRAPAW